MPEGFGARLRRQREGRHIDLGWIAEETKIKRSLLEALERDDVSRWPSGIFRRAYIRTYAQIIGLDPDVILREFLEVHPDPVDVLEAAAAAAAEEAARRNAAPGIRLRTIVDSAIGSLARLRRPGVIEAPGSATRPLAVPARTAAAPPVVPHRPAASVENSRKLEGPLELEHPPPELEEPSELEEPPELEAVSELKEAPGLEQAAAEEEAGGPEELLQARLTAEAPSSGPAPAVPEPPPDLMLDGDDHAREGATASQEDQDIHVAPDAAADERPPSIDSRLEAVATLCTEFGRAVGRDRILMLLEDSARALDATGLIVWLWDQPSDGLRPTLVHGYSDQVLAHLPTVGRDADNATAEAFRTARPCEVTASAHATGALVVPLLIPEGCAGVLAVELQPGIEGSGAVRALATLLAAALAQFVHRSRPLPSGRARMTLRP